MAKKESKQTTKKAAKQAAKAKQPKKESAKAAKAKQPSEPKLSANCKVLKLVKIDEHVPTSLPALRRSARLKALCAVPPELYGGVQQVWPADLLRFLEAEKAVHIAHQYHESTVPSDGKVHTLVLGESHSRTDTQYLGLKIKPEFLHLIPAELREAGHINLVHCASYGEWWLILDGKALEDCPSSGTATWWKLLATLAGVVDPTKRGTDPLEGEDQEVWTTVFKGMTHDCGPVGSEERMQQVKNKVQILLKLKECGICIMDISPIAIFLASGSKKVIAKKSGKTYSTPIHSLKNKDYKAIMQLCWNTYTLPLIKKLKPKQVIILGEKPANAIGRPTSVTCSNGEEAKIHYLIHPSSRTYNQSKYMPILREVRELTKEARKKK